MDQSETTTELLNELRCLREENQLMRQQLLQNSLEKAITDDAASLDIANRMAQFYMFPVSPWYMILIFYGKQPDRPGAPEDSVDCPIWAVKEIFFEALSSFGQTFFFAPPGVVACLLNLSRSGLDGGPAVREDVAKEVQAALLAAAKAHPESSTAYICLSRISNFSGGPRLLFRSASSVSEHRTAHSPFVCGEWELTLPQQQKTAGIYQLEMQFWQQLKQQDFYGAAGTLDQILLSGRSQQETLEQAQPVVFSRLELVLQNIGQKAGMDLMRSPDFAELMAALPRTNTFQALRDTAHDILALLEDRCYTPPDARNRKMVSIERYVQNHYQEQSLGAASISEEFKISASYLSRIFKADMGMSVVDFIRQTRIAAAKHLLQETTFSINEIAEQVGFTNHWVFIRAFKRQEGMTPGNYRSLI